MDLDTYRAIPAPLGGEWAGREVDPAQFKNAWFDIPYANQSPAQTLDVIVPPAGGVSTTASPATGGGGSGANPPTAATAPTTTASLTMAATSTAPFPCVLYIPGGAWLSGDKRSATMQGLFTLPSQGYALVAINYRYSTEVVWPAQIFDVKAALRFIRAHAHAFNLDPQRIAVWGNSAGGHLANMLAATGSRTILEDKTQGAPEQNCAVQALISWYAPTDIYTTDTADMLAQSKEYTLDPCHYPGYSVPKLTAELPTPQARLLGFEPRHHRHASAMASPIEFVDEQFPPALYQHGREDVYVQCSQSVAMARRVNDICGAGRATLELFAGGHGSPAIKATSNINRCISFLDTTIGPSALPRSPLPLIAMR